MIFVDVTVYPYWEGALFLIVHVRCYHPIFFFFYAFEVTLNHGPIGTYEAEEREVSDSTLSRLVIGNPVFRLPLRQ